MAMRTSLLALTISLPLFGACVGVIGGDGDRDQPNEPASSQAAACEGKPAPLGAPVLRRLTRKEYDATVGDLLGLASKWGDSLPADAVVNGFDNDASALRVSGLFADKARVAAEEIAAAANLDALLPCKTQDDACAMQFVRTFGKRAFRRPLADAEATRYAALFTVAKAEGFASGARLVVQAMLQSPSFLYRTELGELAIDGTVTLSPWELASELSYFLWGTMPDQTLFDRAESGDLATPEALEAETRRMIADPKSRVMLDRFFGNLLDLDRLATAPKDPGTYPDFGADVRDAMRAETIEFADRVFRGSGTLTELLTADWSVSNGVLTKFYGYAGGATGTSFEKMSLDGDRGGLLTHGSVLATHAIPNGSSPVHRGKLVRERFLCQTLSPPPPGLNVQLPPFDPTKTTRERFAAHSKVEPCNGCHRLMDPIGFGFEGFDGVGKMRSEEAGKPIDVSGQIVGSQSTDGSFVGVRDLEKKLAASAEVQSCFALQWWRYARGGDSAACSVQPVAKDFIAGGTKIGDLIVGIVRAEGFRRRSAL